MRRWFLNIWERYWVNVVSSLLLFWVLGFVLFQVGVFDPLMTPLPDETAVLLPAVYARGERRPECGPERAGDFWPESDPGWVCTGELWVETPNAGAEMLRPWIVLLVFANGNTDLILFEDGNEAWLQARVIEQLGLKTIVCIGVYYKGELKRAIPPSCQKP